jgi:hypothetical protein
VRENRSFGVEVAFTAELTGEFVFCWLGGVAVFRGFSYSNRRGRGGRWLRIKEGFEAAPCRPRELPGFACRRRTRRLVAGGASDVVLAVLAAL